MKLKKENTPIAFTVDIKEIIIVIAVQIILEKLIDNVTVNDIILITGTTLTFFIALRVHDWTEHPFISSFIIICAYGIASECKILPPLETINLTQAWEKTLIPKAKPILLFYKAIKGFVLTYGWFKLIVATGLSFYFYEERRNLINTSSNKDLVEDTKKMKN